MQSAAVSAGGHSRAPRPGAERGPEQAVTGIWRVGADWGKQEGSARGVRPESSRGLSRRHQCAGFGSLHPAPQTRVTLSALGLAVTVGGHSALENNPSTMSFLFMPPISSDSGRH